MKFGLGFGNRETLFPWGFDIENKQAVSVEQVSAVCILSLCWIPGDETPERNKLVLWRSTLER